MSFREPKMLLFIFLWCSSLTAFCQFEISQMDTLIVSSGDKVEVVFSFSIKLSDTDSCLNNFLCIPTVPKVIKSKRNYTQSFELLFWNKGDIPHYSITCSYPDKAIHSRVYPKNERVSFKYNDEMVFYVKISKSFLKEVMIENNCPDGVFMGVRYSVGDFDTTTDCLECLQVKGAKIIKPTWVSI